MAIAFPRIKQTGWFTTNFAGFNEGLTSGLITSDSVAGISQYKAIKRAYNEIWSPRFGRDINGEEFSSLLAGGIEPDFQLKKFQASDFLAANRSDIQLTSGSFGGGLLDANELTKLSGAVGRSRVGAGERSRGGVQESSAEGAGSLPGDQRARSPDAA